MIDRIIHFSVHNKIIIGLFVFILTGWGIYSVTQLKVDAVPDNTNNQVQIISIAPSLAVQEVELFITAPIEVSVSSIPDVIELRSISRLGLSVVTVVFKDKVDIYWARQQINERLGEAKEQIPEGIARIEMAPISTGLGEIFQYTLDVDKGYNYSLTELRTIQDWMVKRQMLGTPGVADVNSYGGFVKEYEIAVNPDRLKSMGVTLTDLFDALEKNNENTGSAYIDKKPTSYFIRGIGLASSLEDVSKIVVKSSTNGTPVLIRDVASVQFGHAPRYGAFVADTSEVVGGVVMMLKGANAAQVIKVVEERIATIQTSLPKGIHIVPYLDRSDLVGRAIGTVSKNLLEGGLIVIFILVLFLGNMRAGLVVASVIPLSMLFAISLMNLFGVSGNLMSLGAIDFGLIVDGAVIIVESTVHRLALMRRTGSLPPLLSKSEMDDTVYSSARRMMSSATFGQVIILIVYLPILSLIGIEGKMFRPMAEVVSFALIGAILLSVTWVPMASALFLSRKTTHKKNFSDTMMKQIQNGFTPLLSFALRRKALVVGISVVLFLAGIWLFTKLGGEFIPTLEEGDLAAGVITLQGGSLSNTIETVEKANKIMIDNFPEIKRTICKIGAGEIPTDPTPMETGDYIITLKDKSEWTSAESREELVEKIEEKLAVLPGVKFEFQQPIQMRFNELMTGSKQDVAIKLFGDDLDTLTRFSEEIESHIRDIPGIEDINVEKVTGLSQIQVEYNRDRLAQYGLSVSDVNRVLRAAFAGTSTGVIYEEEKRFDLVVRLSEEYRQDLENVRNLPVALPGGQQISLDQVADIRIKSGPAQVSREDAHRRITIGFNVRERDVQTVVAEVKEKLSKEVPLPAGYYLTFGGQFQNLAEARNRLAIAVPVALLLIFILLYFTFHSLRHTLLIYTAVPMAAIGGVFSLYLRGMNFSISAGVGFIALFGVAVLNGIVLIAEFNRLKKEGVHDIHRRVIKGLETRLRPVLMTAAVASLGFLPMALSTSAGAEVQKPLATVVIGGLITSTFLTLLVLPVLYILFSGKERSKRKQSGPGILTSAILLMIILFSGNAVTAQKVVSINEKQAIQIALDSNVMIRQAELEIAYNKALKGTSWDIGKTDFDLELGKINSYTRDNSFTVSQSFSFPSVYMLQSRMNKASVNSSKLQLEITRNELAGEVKSTYWHLAYLYSKREMMKYQDSLFNTVAKAATRRAQSGETNQLEMISAETQHMDARDKLNQTEADIRIYLNRLRRLMNSRSEFIPADKMISKLSLPKPSAAMTVSSNPVLAYHDQLKALASGQTQLEAAKALPDFRIGAFSQTMKGTQEINGIERYFGPEDRFNGFQAGISIPLWTKPSVSRVKSSRITEMIANSDAELARQELEAQLDLALQEYEKYSSTLEFYEKSSLTEAEKIIRQSEAGYKAGAIDYLDHIQNLQRALNIRFSYLETLNQYNQSIINIERLTNSIK